VFPDLPAYQVVTVKGVPCIFLNGRSCGLLEPAQRAWFREQVRKHHRPGSTLVIVLHQPSLGRVVRECGIPAAVREALADCRGDLWMVSGHEHRNEDACFRLPQAVITQATITAGNPATWGTELPGDWVLWLHEQQERTGSKGSASPGALAPAPTDGENGTRNSKHHVARRSAQL
jgi:hypothetical protein